jgi:hypothetical protein
MKAVWDICRIPYGLYRRILGFAAYILVRLKIQVVGGEHVFTIGLALLLANTKYFSEHFGGQAAAAKVGAIAGLVVDVGILFYVFTRFFL